MSDFTELIKNFERIRDYMRQFFVYGFKVRNEYTQKSARTYDNERRRIESYLKEYTKSEYTGKGKQVFISVDSKQISQNPLYRAWKSKSFTDNDIMLHFFLCELLRNKKMTANELADEISMVYGSFFDSQTVRLKLKEYEKEGIVKSKKEGKQLYYFLAEETLLEKKSKDYITAVKYFQETAPFGFIGSTILDQEREENEYFRFKHHYIVHTLEDGVLYEILEAVKEQRKIQFENRSTKSGIVSLLEGVPLKIFVGTQTGRRYVCIYKVRERRFINVRLDSVTHVKHLDVYEAYGERMAELDNNIRKCWGVSFSAGSRGVRIEEIFLKLRIDEKKEKYILERLNREGRGGEVLKVDENLFLYSGAFFDTNEMLPWIKTFIGRIVDIQGTNSFVIGKLEKDLDLMYEMYCSEEEGESDGTVF